MDAIKKATITKNELEALGYTVKVFPGGYQALYNTDIIDSWTNPGSFLPKDDGSSGMEEFYEGMAWQEVQTHYHDNSGITVLNIGDVFEIWDNKSFKVESIQEDVVHCVMVKPVAPAGASVTRDFKVSDLTVAVDLEIKEKEQ